MWALITDVPQLSKIYAGIILVLNIIIPGMCTISYLTPIFRLRHHDRELLPVEVQQDPLLRGPVPAAARTHVRRLLPLNLLGLPDREEGLHRLARVRGIPQQRPGKE